MKYYIPSLNGLRAISIFFVLYAHVLLKSFNFSENPGGQVGVTVFFVISGYLITLLLLKEEASNGSISLKSFYLRRTIRIFPIYYVLLLVYFLLQEKDVLNFSANSWITSLTYTKYLAKKAGSDWETGHLWSLSIEEHFYLIWPIVFCFFRKYRILLAFLVIIFVTINRLVSNTSAMHILTRADALMWGCVFAVYNKRIVSFFKAKTSIYAVLPFAILLFALVFKRVFTLLHFTAHENFVTTFLGSYGLITDFCIGLAIIISIHFKNNLWYTFLNTAPLNFIGKLSYSIYLWQQLFFSSRIGRFSTFPYNILLIFIVAFLSYNFIEKPFLRLKPVAKNSPIPQSLVPSIQETV